MGAHRIDALPAGPRVQLRSTRPIGKPIPAVVSGIGSPAAAARSKETRPIEILENPSLSMGEKLLLIEALFVHDPADLIDPACGLRRQVKVDGSLSVGSEAIADARLGDQRAAGGRDPARACAGAASCRPGGSGSARWSGAPRHRAEAACVNTLPACLASVASSLYSVGVRCTTAPSTEHLPRARNRPSTPRSALSDR